MASLGGPEQCGGVVFILCRELVEKGSEELGGEAAGTKKAVEGFGVEAFGNLEEEFVRDF